MSYSNPWSSNTSKKEPTAVSVACRKFVKSPLILSAIIAYTVYTVISVIQGVESLKYLNYCVELFNVSFFLTVAVIIALFMFIPPIIIICGLWTMYNYGGCSGSNTIRTGINTYLGMTICMVSCLLLSVISVFNSGAVLSENLDILVWPLAYLCFGLVAIASLRNFADAVQSSALGGNPCTDDASKSGILLAIFLVLSLFAYQGLIDDFELGASIAVMNDLGSEVVVYSRVVALLLFCISAFIYRENMNRARAVDQNTTASSLGGWKCSCGRTNPNYCRTCVCGASKPVGSVKEDAPAATQPTKQETVEKVPASNDTDQEASTEGQSTGQKVEQEKTVRDYIFCSECGEKCPGQAKFCRNCGSRII